MDQIEEVRRKTDIVQLISEAVALKKAGRNFKGLCPFHDEKTPSFIVSSERQIFKCFGCQTGGDCYGWLMKREGIEFGEALRLLAQKAGVELKDFRPSPDQKIKERLLEINHLAAEFYHYLLTEHRLGKRGMEYLLKRGITKDSIRLFKLGYSPNEWQGLTDYLTKKKGYKLNELEQAGLAIKGNGGRYYDRFRGRIMFPLFDHRGRVVGFAGRVLDPEEKEAKYINSPETVLYHKSLILYGLEISKEAIKKANRVIVVEGELDAISSYQAGVKNVAAIKGSALTEGQIELLKRFCENVSLALDSDSAGEAASRRGIELAEKLGLNVRIIRVKEGKDPDECAQKSARLWKDSVAEAVAVYDFLIEAGVKRYGVKTVEGKRKLSEEMAGALAKVENEVIKAYYMKKLAKVLEVEEEAVRMEVDKVGKITTVEPPFAPSTSLRATEGQSKTRQERLEEYLLALILQADKEMEKFVSLVKPEEWGETVIKKVLEQLQRWFKKDKEWEINKFVRSLAEELVAQVDAAYLLDLGRLTEDRDRLKREIEKTLADIERLNIKQKLEKLSKEINQAEKEKDRAKLNKLQKEFREMAKSLI
jgi:DNA primase